jgi:simple sugar transport system ATP-binding protein
LTPQESDRLFVTLKKLVEGGLSIIFISHKLREVMAVSDRVAVLRQGKLVAERPTAGTHPTELATLMVGREVRPPVREPLEPGAPVLELRRLGFTDAEGHRRLDGIDLVVREREIVGIAGVSGNGQSALADVLSGTSRRSQGEILLFDQAIGAADPADLVGRGIGRIPEDRHRTGVVADMSVWENGIAEELRSPAFSRGGILRRGAAREHARGVIEEFSVACPSEEAPIRLLSGGNMQKLILGRVLTRGPRCILASQPTRGLDIGAVAYIHRRLLDARAAGAGILLVSEDLDEILLLADRIAVIYRGRLSPALAHDAVTVPMLGAMMAGRLDGDAHAA